MIEEQGKPTQLAENIEKAKGEELKNFCILE
jgi:hypothetical protein